jgi:hypothetical protein
VFIVRLAARTSSMKNAINKKALPATSAAAKHGSYESREYPADVCTRQLTKYGYVLQKGVSK